MDGKDRARLLNVARKALQNAVVNGRAPAEIVPQAEASPCGAFVCLHSGTAAIRGCVGCMSTTRPLPEVVAELAQAAGLHDPRFPAVRPEELRELDIEISLVGPVEPLDSLADLEIGRDGLFVSGLGRRGVLLPQVASLHGWDTSTFVAQTCIKAGLKPNAWNEPGVELYRFSAEVFSERSEKRRAELN